MAVRNVKIKNGHIALTSVLLLAAVAGIVMATALTLSTDASLQTEDQENALFARKSAETCAEYAIDSLKADLTYLGNETIALGAYSCTILPISGDLNTDRGVQVQGEAEDSIQKIEIIIAEVRPDVIIQKWQEVGDFSEDLVNNDEL